mmetsp:Transcript_17404/g.30360  ORF Transcript_17404/g.30360 Transcript_17404/m.30360 type:complete len:196 (+) Transcript_17404:74-661(+)
MSLATARKKILKPDEYTPTDVENAVAQALFDVQINSDLKAELADLHFVAAREVKVNANKQAIIVFVPYRELQSFHRIQARLVRELEKKFSGKHVVIIAQRRILRKPGKNNKRKLQKRPYSRTQAAVHEAILEDLTFPSEITGKRLRFKLDGSKQLKIHLDKKDQQAQEGRLDTYHVVYKKLTGKDAVFMFPVTTD